MEIIKKTLSEKKRIFIPVLILVFVFSLGFIFNFIQGNSNASLDKQVKINSEIPITEAASLSNKVEVREVRSELPVRLEIPSINIDATIEYLGLTSLGEMDSPVGPAEVGWYNLGPRPGEQGSAVIDGHSGWKDGVPAVFDDLYKLKIGDKVYVLNDMGVTTTFIVREIRKYDPNADASDVFISNDGKSHLNLITCTGVWNETTKSHSERLVVFTDLVE